MRRYIARCSSFGCDIVRMQYVKNKLPHRTYATYDTSARTDICHELLYKPRSAFSAFLHPITMKPLLDLHAADFAALFVAAAFLFVLTRGLRWRPRKFPPGPKGVPILGNVRDIPDRFEWKTYKKWSSVYGTSYLTLQPKRRSWLTCTRRIGYSPSSYSPHPYLHFEHCEGRK